MRGRPRDSGTRTRTSGRNRNEWDGGSLMGIIAWIVLGAIAGYLAGMLVKGDEGLGVIGHIVLGIIGALVGGFLAGTVLKVADVTGINIESIVVAVIGAIITVVVVNAVTGRSRTGRGAICPGQGARSPPPRST